MRANYSYVKSHIIDAQAARKPTMMTRLSHVVRKSRIQKRSLQRYSLKPRDTGDMIARLMLPWLSKLSYFGLFELFETLKPNTGGIVAWLKHALFFQVPINGNLATDLLFYQNFVSVVIAIIVSVQVLGIMSRFTRLPSWLIWLINLFAKTFFDLFCGTVVSMFIRCTNCIVIKPDGDYEMISRGYFTEVGGATAQPSPSTPVNWMFNTIECDGGFGHRLVLFGFYAIAAFFIASALGYCSFLQHQKNFSERALLSMPYMQGFRLAVLVIVVFVKASFIFSSTNPYLALQLIAPVFTFVMVTLLVIQIYLKIPYLGAGTKLANSIEAGIFGVAAASNIVLILVTVLNFYDASNSVLIGSIVMVILFPVVFYWLFTVTLQRASKVDEFEALQKLVDLPAKESIDAEQLVPTSALLTLLLQSREDIQVLLAARLRTAVKLHAVAIRATASAAVDLERNSGVVVTDLQFISTMEFVQRVSRSFDGRTYILKNYLHPLLVHQLAIRSAALIPLTSAAMGDLSLDLSAGRRSTVGETANAGTRKSFSLDRAAEGTSPDDDGDKGEDGKDMSSIGDDEATSLHGLNCSLVTMKHVVVTLTNVANHSKFAANRLMQETRLVAYIVRALNSLTLSASVIYSSGADVVHFVDKTYNWVDGSKTAEEMKFEKRMRLKIRTCKQLLKLVYNVRGALLVLLRPLIPVKSDISFLDVPIRLKGLHQITAELKSVSSLASEKAKLDSSAGDSDTSIASGVGFEVYEYLMNVSQSIQEINSESELGYFTSLSSKRSTKTGIASTLLSGAANEGDAFSFIVLRNGDGELLALDRTRIRGEYRRVVVSSRQELQMLNQCIGREYRAGLLLTSPTFIAADFSVYAKGGVSFQTSSTKAVPSRDTLTEPESESDSENESEGAFSSEREYAKCTRANAGDRLSRLRHCFTWELLKWPLSVAPVYTDAQDLSSEGAISSWCNDAGTQAKSLFYASNDHLTCPTIILRYEDNSALAETIADSKTLNVVHHSFEAEAKMKQLKFRILGNLFSISHSHTYIVLTSIIRCIHFNVHLLILYMLGICVGLHRRRDKK